MAYTHESYKNFYWKEKNKAREQIHVPPAEPAPAMKPLVEVKNKTVEAVKNNNLSILNFVCNIVLVLLIINSIGFFFALLADVEITWNATWHILFTKSRYQGQLWVVFCVIITIALLGWKLKSDSYTTAKRVLSLISILVIINLVITIIDGDDKNYKPKEILKQTIPITKGIDGLFKPKKNPPPTQAQKKPASLAGPVKLPTIKYLPGESKKFVLKKGARSDHFINVSQVDRIRWQSEYGDYQIHTKSGKKFSKGHVPLERIFEEEFIVYAVTDVCMTISFF